jgi:hypothetical protein
VDADKQAHYASCAQAEGVSLPVARRLLAVFLKERTPSVAQLGRFSQAAAQRSTRLLAVLDAASRPLVDQAAADEIFVGRKPILMVVAQESLCWTNGRLAEHRDGPTWAAELRQLPALEQLTRDSGSGMAKGLEQVNDERQRQGLPSIADQSDHFHLRQEGCGSRKPRRPAGSTQQGSVVMYENEPTRRGCSDGKIRRPGGTPTARMASRSCQGWRTKFMADPMRLRRQA